MKSTQKINVPLYKLKLKSDSDEECGTNFHFIKTLLNNVYKEEKEKEEQKFKETFFSK